MTHQQRKQNPPSLLEDDSLYCEEEHWVGEETNNYCHYNNPKPLLLLEQDLFCEGGELTCLFSKEKQQQNSCLINNFAISIPLLSRSRREAVDWILNVVDHYSFSAVTAVLAVNYLDRFLLYSFQFQRDEKEKPWMSQLVAVTCLSLAAKVEETHVPLLLDLQVEETKYVFEAKTIQKMEILVLSSLQWMMNPVTPLSFIDYTMRRLGLKSHICFEFLKRCECLLVSVIADLRSMCYLPSVIATVTMLYVMNSTIEPPCIGLEYQTQILAILGIDKDKLEDCCNLIQELTSRGFGQYQSNKRKFGSLPGSPNGVMDISLCSDSSNDSWEVAASPEPLSKKSKTEDIC
ncbi:hypothetical protein LguiA_006616 [Lonicera macranthoides]